MRRPLLFSLLLAGSATLVAAAPYLHDLTGTWNFVVVTENGTGRPTVTLKQEGEKVTGTYVSNAMGSRTLEGKVRNDSLFFTFSGSGAGEGVILTYAAHIVTADSLNGYVDFAGQGGAPFTATRQKK